MTHQMTCVRLRRLRANPSLQLTLAKHPSASLRPGTSAW